MTSLQIIDFGQVSAVLRQLASFDRISHTNAICTQPRSLSKPGPKHSTLCSCISQLHLSYQGQTQHSYCADGSQCNRCHRRLQPSTCQNSSMYNHAVTVSKVTGLLSMTNRPEVCHLDRHGGRSRRCQRGRFWHQSSSTGSPSGQAWLCSRQLSCLCPPGWRATRCLA